MKKETDTKHKLKLIKDCSTCKYPGFYNKATIEIDKQGSTKCIFCREEFGYRNWKPEEYS